MLPITDLAREAALAIAVLVAGVYPSGTVDGAPPGRASRRYVQWRRGQRTRLTAREAETPASLPTTTPHVLRHPPRFRFERTGTAIVRLDGELRQRAQGTERWRRGRCPVVRRRCGPTGTTTPRVRSDQRNLRRARQSRGGQNPERTRSDSESTDSESSDSESTYSESSTTEHSNHPTPTSPPAPPAQHTPPDPAPLQRTPRHRLRQLQLRARESGKSGGEDSSKSAGEESGSGESEYEPSSDGDSDDQATDRSDEESGDEEAVQTRNETGGRTQLVGQERAVQYPADLINTDQWYLTLPTGEPGSPDTVEGEQLKAPDHRCSWRFWIGHAPGHQRRVGPQDRGCNVRPAQLKRGSARRRDKPWPSMRSSSVTQAMHGRG